MRAGKQGCVRRMWYYPVAGQSLSVGCVSREESCVSGSPTGSSSKSVSEGTLRSKIFAVKMLRPKEKMTSSRRLKVP